MMPVGQTPFSIGTDVSWAHPRTAPLGTFANNNSTRFNQLYRNWFHYPVFPTEVHLNNTFWGLADQAMASWNGNDPASCYLPWLNNGDVNPHYATQGVPISLEPTPSECQINQAVFAMFHLGLNSEADFLKMIETKDKLFDSSPLSAHLYEYGPITTFWKVFIELEGTMMTLLAADAVCIFLAVSLLMGGDFLTGLITTVACLGISIVVYGLACAVMPFNIFIAAMLLMTMGMSVEFVCHMSAAYANGNKSASLQKKLGAAMEHTMPAIFEGCVSTFTGIFCLAFHSRPFVVKFMFGMTAMVIGTGAVFGFFFLPALISLIANLTGKAKGSEDDVEEKREEIC